MAVMTFQLRDLVDGYLSSAFQEIREDMYAFLDQFDIQIEMEATEEEMNAVDFAATVESWLESEAKDGTDSTEEYPDSGSI